MPKHKKNPSKVSNNKVKLNRKQLRKEKRKEKKLKRNDYFMKKTSRFASKDIAVIAKKLTKESDLTVKAEIQTVEKENHKNLTKKLSKSDSDPTHRNEVLSIEELNKKEKREQKKLQKGMLKQRKGQLLKENEKEDDTIRKLEKQLKLNKKKSKAIPKSFAADGLDYLLEVCDPEYMKNAAAAARYDLPDGSDNFEEDFELMTDKKRKNVDHCSESDSEDIDNFLNEDDGSDTDLCSNSDYEGVEDNEYDDDSENEKIEDEDDEVSCASETDSNSLESISNDPKNKNKAKSYKCSKSGATTTVNATETPDDLNMDDDSINTNPKRKNSNSKDKVKAKKKKIDNENENPLQLIEENTGITSDEIEEGDDVGDRQDDGVWEDIYGRLRSKDGAVLDEKSKNEGTGGKYIPPAIRAKMTAAGCEDKNRKEKLDRLKRQLKGLLNRLAENNMHNISNQIEQLYLNYSRNDMNESLTQLILEVLLSSIMTPERLLMEHVLLIVILHANVGTEVGAYFLQTVIKTFDKRVKSIQKVEDKTLDNTVNVLAQLYNFKVFDAKLLFEILNQLSLEFEEKNVDCILHVLRSVGFSIRKDDPLALKSLILDLQKKAASASEGKISNSRVKFLLDVLLAIKNNNVTKIPNYDVSYSEHLKKVMKGFIRTGNYVTTLNISLEDLLKAEERGKWWVVGSAWTGKTDDIPKKQESLQSEAFSKEIMDLARKQRMNTDTRRTIFSVIMSADDYVDAFEKLLRLGLKNQQEREIIHVIMHCCLQEKTFNPFYAVLAQKFCECDRRFQMTIKCSAWDKLKTLSSHSGPQISNLAKLLSHLFIHKGLPISTLKIVEFSDLDKVTLRLIRQILLGILLHDDLEEVKAVFSKVAISDKLKMFRESLRLFIHHFLLRNLKGDVLSEDQKQHLESRSKLIEQILTTKEFRSSR